CIGMGTNTRTTVTLARRRCSRTYPPKDCYIMSHRSISKTRALVSSGALLAVLFACSSDDDQPQPLPPVGAGAAPPFVIPAGSGGMPASAGAGGMPASGGTP